MLQIHYKNNTLVSSIHVCVYTLIALSRHVQIYTLTHVSTVSVLKVYLHARSPRKHLSSNPRTYGCLMFSDQESPCIGVESVSLSRLVLLSLFRSDCPRFGFSFSPLSPPSLLELPSPARSLIDCASRCNDFHYPSSSSSIFSFFTFSSSSAPSSSSLCQGYEYDRRTRLCSLYGALGDSPAVAVPSPYVASGLSPSKTTGSLCVSSCLVSEWSEWTGACPTRSGPAAASSGKKRVLYARVRMCICEPGRVNRLATYVSMYVQVGVERGST